MFKIKICGITNVEDSLAAVDAGADAIGLNFYDKSVRCVSARKARTITDAVYDAIDISSFDPIDIAINSRLIYTVGVFVNYSVDDVRKTFDDARLVAAQLHGDEPPETIGQLTGIPVIRARRFREGGQASIADDLLACRQAAVNIDVVSPFAVLVDAMTPDGYGGTGKTVNWSALADHSVWLSDAPLILAGGLTPQNVDEAIRTVRPHAVDVASGVESAPGKKDTAKMRDFVAAARAAFAAL